MGSADDNANDALILYERSGTEPWDASTGCRLSRATAHSTTAKKVLHLDGHLVHNRLAAGLTAARQFYFREVVYE